MHVPRKPRTVGAYAAKTHLPALLKRVERGEEITIQRHGKPIARLIPIQLAVSVDEAFDRILGFQKKIKLRKGETARQLVEAGRRM